MAGHRQEKYTTGVRLGTSRDLGWEGVLAERWRHSQGDLGEVRHQDTEVIVQLGGQLHVRRRGDGRLQYSDAVPGTVFLCPAGIYEDMVHLYGPVEESLHLYFPPTFLPATALRELDVDPARVSLLYEGGFTDPLVERIAWTIRTEMTDVAPAGRMLVETLTEALGVYLLRNYSNLAEAMAPLPSVQGALDPRRLELIREFVDAHLNEDVSLDRLASKACLSPFHFARAFKAATGRTPHRYVIERRIQYAKKLIAENRLPLATIAEKCGFCSQAHFTTWFRRLVGRTPMAFKRG